jgi:energy-coupling factor transporter ATP-binding protein EcfA2
MLTSLAVRNFKSIVDLTLELGRFNLLIGENGCGKTNILEALAMAAGAQAGRLGNEELFLRGVRIAKPSLMANAFADITPSRNVEITLHYSTPGEEEPARKTYRLENRNGEWFDPSWEKFAQEVLRVVKQSSLFKNALDEMDSKAAAEALLLTMDTARLTTPASLLAVSDHHALIQSFAIYCADTLALRGLQVQSRHAPLGLFGEGLDVAIASLPPELRARLVEHARVISWLDDIDIDREGARKLEGYKLGRSLSDLYFADRFLAGDNRLFSAENANEGILHVLFHLVLFMHPDTPRCFGIDNIETALNPHLLRHMVKTLAALAKDNDRQAIVTTHNPAALDGLNLHDDDQRLFVVYRNDEGHTQARRIRIKPEASVDGSKLKLSELWMRGMLGAIPTHF